MLLSNIFRSSIILLCASSNVLGLPRNELTLRHISDRSILERKLKALEPRRGQGPDITDLSEWEQHFHVDGTSYSIAVNWGQTVAPWLMKLVVDGLGSALNTQITNNGGNLAQAMSPTNLQWVYDLPWEDIALHFALRIHEGTAGYGSDNFELRAAVVAITNAITKIAGHRNQLLSGFMLYRNDLSGNPASWFTGSFLELDESSATGPNGRAGRVNVTNANGSVNSLQSSNKQPSIDLATLQQPG